MKKNKLLRTLIFSVLGCGLLLFSIMLTHKTEVNKTKKMSLNEGKTYFSSIPKKINVLNASEPSDELVIKERLVVFKCQDCKKDKSVIALEKGLDIKYWESYLMSLEGIPNWILGKGNIPYTKNVNCENLTELYSQTIYTANMYVDYGLALKNGANLVIVSKSGSKIFKSGSREHMAAQREYKKAMDLSFKTTGAVLKKMKPLECIKSKKK